MSIERSFSDLGECVRARHSSLTANYTSENPRWSCTDILSSYILDRLTSVMHPKVHTNQAVALFLEQALNKDPVALNLHKLMAVNWDKRNIGL